MKKSGVFPILIILLLLNQIQNPVFEMGFKDHFFQCKKKIQLVTVVSHLLTQAVINASTGRAYLNFSMRNFD
ncbi:hypothetical protein FGO68_gene2799 [Halteria grandinella]|uniref:Uncharacterized protein n=1 Tax=Halteria grandinella TaxID=5974 RepID=A0A8J8NPK3_HALGN|nr:hypothetical protein FGO68_gene2799 [Halteria grandinella]